MKKCNRCDKTKPIDAFDKNVNMKSGRLNQCKECRKKTLDKDALSKYHKTYYECNKESLLAHSKQWKLDNPLKNDVLNHNARLRLRKGVDTSKYYITLEEVQSLIDVYGMVCMRCGCELHLKSGVFDGRFSIDHIHNIEPGYDCFHNIRNIQFLCRRCNIIKRKRTRNYRKMIDQGEPYYDRNKKENTT